MKAKRYLTELLRLTLAAVLGTAFLIFPSETASSAREALIYAASTVIPTLFPFMVVSKLLGSSRATQKLAEKAKGTLFKLFGLKSDAIISVMLGFISGFPIGALTVCDSYKDGRLTKAEAERTLALSHNTGPSFPIGLVGAVLWNDRKLGVVLYMSQLLSWIMVALAYRANANAERGYPAAVHGKRQESKTPLISDIICTSATACVSIAAFTAFMSVCAESIDLLLPNIPFYANVLFVTVLEFSQGCRQAARIGGVFGIALSSFAVSFGGLSAYMQGSSYANKLGLSAKPMLLVKLIQGTLASGLCVAYYTFFSSDNTFHANKNQPALPSGIVSNLLLSVIILSILFILLHKCVKNDKTS